jgi:hypothetical protein
MFDGDTMLGEGDHDEQEAMIADPEDPPQQASLPGTPQEAEPEKEAEGAEESKGDKKKPEKEEKKKPEKKQKKQSKKQLRVAEHQKKKNETVSAAKKKGRDANKKSRLAAEKVAQFANFTSFEDFKKANVEAATAAKEATEAKESARVEIDKAKAEAKESIKKELDGCCNTDVCMSIKSVLTCQPCRKTYIAGPPATKCVFCCGSFLVLVAVFLLLPLMITNDIQDESAEVDPTNTAAGAQGMNTVDTIGLIGGIFAGIGATFTSAMIILKICFITKPGQHPDWPNMSVNVWIGRWKKMETKNDDFAAWKEKNVFARLCKQKAEEYGGVAAPDYIAWKAGEDKKKLEAKELEAKKKKEFKNAAKFRAWKAGRKKEVKHEAAAAKKEKTKKKAEEKGEEEEAPEDEDEDDEDDMTDEDDMDMDF